jgi:hypothetical protein
MRTRFDHAVIVVEELAAALALFRDAGFTVTPGGRHDAVPTENALVAFRDGAYLELLALRDPSARVELRALRREPDRWAAHLQGASAIGRRFLPRLAGRDGVADSCLAGEHLERVAAESRRRGFVMTGPVAMARERPRVEPLAWELLLPAEDAIPFLIEDRTPRQRRVPGEAPATAHANGATGVAAVTLGAREPATLAMRLVDLFGAALASERGRTRASFAAIEWWIEPAATDGALGVSVAGTGALPAAIEALGVRGAA